MDRRGSELLGIAAALAMAIAAAAPGSALGQLIRNAQIQIAPAAAARAEKDADVAEGQEKPDDSAAHVFSRPTREDLRNLAAAQRLLEDGRTSEAIGFLQAILNGPEDFFYQPDPKRDTRLSLKREAQRLIGQMPPEGLQLYELRYGAEARELLRKATADGDALALPEVSRRFFHTQAGYEAAFLLGLHHLDQGRALAAALTLERLQSTCPSSDRFEPMLSLALAAAWARTRMPGEAQAVLLRLKAARGRGSIPVGGKDLPLFVRDSDALTWLASIVGPQGAEGPGEEDQWLMVRGNPARAGVSSGSGPLLNMRWRVPAADHPLVEQVIQRIKQDHEDQGMPCLPGFHPLAAGDVVMMRTVRNLLALDFRTGKRIWEVPVGDGLEAALAGGNQPVAMGQTSQVQAGLAQRVWQDATYGTMSSDGTFVFSIEDIPLAGPVPGAPQIIIANRARGQGAARTCNRLAAHDIRTGKLKWHVGGGADDFDLPLSGTFFLGPPLPLMGQLYVIGEARNEVRLMVLDARSGDLAWSQQLAPVEQDYDQGMASVRRMMGVSPSYADGILVCPTSTGAVVAVDLATRSLLWGYPYSQQTDGRQRSRIVALRMGFPGGMGQQPTGQWMDATPVLADGRVLLTPPESDHLHCLALADGKEAWKLPREDAIYVACVHRGKVVLVAPRDVRAVNLDDGRPAWDGRRVDLPEGANPSGQGFASGGEYFLPLSTAEVAGIDLEAGRIARRAKSRGGSVPGNLVCTKGKVVSQGPDGLEVFYQLDGLRAVADSRLAANPEDAEALAFRGEILLDEGKRAEAVAALRRSLELAAEPRTRDLLRDALFEGLRDDFAAHRGLTPEIERLIDAPADRATYLRLMAAGHQSVQDYGAALEGYLALAGVDDLKGQTERLSKALSVRRDRWLQAQLAGLREAAPDDFRTQIDQAVEARRQAAIEAGTPEALQRFLDAYGNQPAAAAARKELIARLARAGRLLEAELLLREQERSADPGAAAAAVAETAEMLRASGKAADAAVYYRRLAGELADVSCREGKTGRQIVHALPPESDVAKLLGDASAWPVGRVELAKSQAPPPQTSFHGRFVLSFDNSPEPFFSDTTVLFDQNRRMLLGYDAYGRELWKPLAMTRAGVNPNVFFAYNRGLSRVNVQGHLMVLSMGFMIQAFDMLGGPGAEGPKLLWTQDLTDSGLADPSNPFGMGGIQLFQLRQMQLARYQRGPNTGLGPVTERFVCFQRLRHVTAVDAVTGEVLWVRSDVPPGSDLFGDEERIFAVPPGKPYALVLRALDGQMLGKRDLPRVLRREARPVPADPNVPALPAADEDGEEAVEVFPFQQFCIGTIGRNLLIWRPEGDKFLLELFDVWEQKNVWGPHAFDSSAKYARAGQEAVGVMESSGWFTLIALADGRQLVREQLEPEPSLQGIYLLRLRGQYFLVAHCPNRPGVPVQPSQPLPGTQFGPVASGRVYGFSPEGAKLWKAPVEVEQQQLLLSQPSGLPVLVFASQVYERRAGGGGSFHVAVLAIDKRSGRKVCDEKFTNSSGVFELSGDPQKNTVEVVTQRDKLTMTFTGEPWPATEPAPKAPAKIGEAILRSFQKAVKDQAPGGGALEDLPLQFEELEMPVAPVKVARPAVAKPAAPEKPEEKKPDAEKPAVKEKEGAGP